MFGGEVYHMYIFFLKLQNIKEIIIMYATLFNGKTLILRQVWQGFIEGAPQIELVYAMPYSPGQAICNYFYTFLL